MLPPERAQEILATKDVFAARRSARAHGYDESWAIIDGAVVIYNVNAPPSWLPERDEDGNSVAA